VRNSELTELKPDKAAIGGLQLRTDIRFNLQSFQLQKNDCVYMFTDGYADQFGGVAGKKMLSRKVKDKLVSISHLPMKEQQQLLLHNLRDWQGSFEQVDDILIIGFKI
jgi:serine phosphatase RsbU (regulator of sigma subunit)